MLVAQVERLSDCMEEWAAHHPDHWRELALNRDVIPLNPDYARYRAMDEAGLILFVTLRDEGRLVGYFVGFLMNCLHYQVPTCTMDIFWTHPSIRGRFGGVRLFRAVKAELQRLGVVRCFVGEKLHKPAGRLFRYLGFKPIEQYYSLLIG